MLGGQLFEVRGEFEARGASAPPTRVDSRHQRRNAWRRHRARRRCRHRTEVRRVRRRRQAVEARRGDRRAAGRSRPRPPGVSSAPAPPRAPSPGWTRATHPAPRERCAPTGITKKSWKSSWRPACRPPLRMLTIGIGSRTGRPAASARHSGTPGRQPRRGPLQATPRGQHWPRAATCPACRRVQADSSTTRCCGVSPTTRAAISPSMLATACRTPRPP